MGVKWMAGRPRRRMLQLGALVAMGVLDAASGCIHALAAPGIDPPPVTPPAVAVTPSSVGSTGPPASVSPPLPPIGRPTLAPALHPPRIGSLASNAPPPSVTTTDSVQVASPGDSLGYTVRIDARACSILHVTDMLPAGFIFQSASGDLGGQPVLVPRNGDATNVEFFPLGAVPSDGTLVETILVQVSPNAAVGVLYVSNVSGESVPPAGSTGCGTFGGSDAGVFVVSPGAQGGSASTPGGGTTSPGSASQGSRPPSTGEGSTPNTAAASPHPLAPWLALAGLVAAFRVTRRARRRLTVAGHR